VQSPRFAVFAIALPLYRCFDYRVDGDDELLPGSRYRLPFGRGTRTGVLLESAGGSDFDADKIKPVLERLDRQPVLDEHMLALARWMSEYYLQPPGDVLFQCLPGYLRGARTEQPLRVKRWRWAADDDAALAALERGSPRQFEIAQALSRVPRGLTAAEFKAINPNWHPVVKALEGKQLICWDWDDLGCSPQIATDLPRLSAEQADIVAAIELRLQCFAVHLLDGITGSGKTEVYLRLIASCLAAGRQAIYLVPEIGLTGQLIERVRQRFGECFALSHSGLTEHQRYRAWDQFRRGEAVIMLGTRSSLFSQSARLGLIVVDEEHDLAYKQEDRVFYNARDMAVVRGHLAGFPVVLSSATPSVESRVNADAGRYRRIVLSDRYAAATLPEVSAIDLRVNQPERGRFLSPPLVAAVAETLEQTQQALLFLNRRGYAPLTLCRSCGHRFQCPNCSTWLVEHRFRGVLLCHHCGHSEPRPDHCPNCGDTESLVAVGPGVERLAEEVGARFPDARMIVMSSDIGGGVQRLRLDLESIAKGEVDIVIGTQLVAKGHNFPLLTLVGIVDGDLGLSFGDMRAAERTFQLLSQVTGRAGRSGGASRALVQTHAPEHPVIRAIVSGDREAFYASEIEARRAAALPPFGRLAGIVISGMDRGETQSHAAAFRRAAPVAEAIQVLGPAEAPLAVVRGRHRFRILVHTPRNTDIQAYLRDWLASAPKARGSVRVQVDIDPQTFM
jgi:primosomal protein N' (replication factor Y)